MAARERSLTGRIASIAGIGLAAAALAAAITAAAIIARFARAVVTPPRAKDEDQRILSVREGAITLAPTVDALTPGRYSLWFDRDAGHARVGEILSRTDSSVTRELLSVDFGDLARARTGRFSGWFYLHPDELGFPFEDVDIETNLGPAPAWLVPAAEGTAEWAILVHGRAVRRQEALRAVPVFREAGFTSLLVSYRNDGDAPRSSDHRFALGDAEWRDVDAAVSFALDNGAKRIVLMGWSMGGATVLQVATRSAHAGVIRGIVLDSPVIDWVTALEYQGELNRIPRQLRRPAMAAISNDWGRMVTGQSTPIDLDRLDFVHRASELTAPILLLHSDDDGYIPSTASRALAIARPDIVTFESFATARHTRLWNYDPERWNSVIARWLTRLP
jgi:hypothetical protein